MDEQQTMTTDEVRAIHDQYLSAVEAALSRRDAQLRQAVVGRSQETVKQLTGYSLETIRKALNPGLREQINQSRRKPVKSRKRT